MIRILHIRNFESALVIGKKAFDTISIDDCFLVDASAYLYPRLQQSDNNNKSRSRIKSPCSTCRRPGKNLPPSHIRVRAHLCGVLPSCSNQRAVCARSYISILRTRVSSRLYIYTFSLSIRYLHACTYICMSIGKTPSACTRDLVYTGPPAKKSRATTVILRLCSFARGKFDRVAFNDSDAATRG